METSPDFGSGQIFLDLGFSSEERRVSRSASRDFGRDLLTLAATSCSPILPSLLNTAPNGWYGRTSPASCLSTPDMRLEPLSKGWKNSGIMRPGECLTLSTCEWTAWDAPSLSDEGVCSLSDILVIGDVPQRYYLTPKACRGILRRAEKRGKDLPENLRKALEMVANDI